MKYCIVNADDFGLSRGITDGIIDAHQRGVVTSTSLMVNTPHSEDAVVLSRDVPTLSIGLHVNFTGEGSPPLVDLTDPDACRAELHRQFHRFREMTGTLPTHVDSHHNVHRDPLLRDSFLDLANTYNLPLRHEGDVDCFGNFYGQWDGETHPEQISVEMLTHMLETEFSEEITEICCHPGYATADVDSIYFEEREMELRTLCDPRIQQAFVNLDIQLISFRELNTLQRPH